MSLKIAAVEVLPQYKLWVRFGNGQSRLFDVGPYLGKGVFKELRDESYLKKVRIISGGIEWPHEQDLSADTLYYRGVPLKKPDKALPRARFPRRLRVGQVFDPATGAGRRPHRQEGGEGHLARRLSRLGGKEVVRRGNH
jgi:hypothetical protein